MSPPFLGPALSLTFAAFSIWALWLNRGLKSGLVFSALLLCVLAWYVSLSPSHERQWRADVRTMPRAIIDGDQVRLTGYRNFDYESSTEFTENYEERVVNLSEIQSLDLFVSYWKVGPVAHTFVSFNFANGPPVSISIEIRPEDGEFFKPLASMFKRFEVIYVVGDERDLVRSRTNYRNEEVFLYPIKARPEGVRALFEVYLRRINQLADEAEWYHLLKNNCTINIMRYAHEVGGEGAFDFRQLLNGWFDRYLYDIGTIDTTLPFEQLREQSRINEEALAADSDPDFSEAIRVGLPGYR